MHGGSGALRAALAITSLLLLAAAGAHFMLLRNPAWVEDPGLWARRLEAAAWAPWQPAPVGGALPQPAVASLSGASAGMQGQALHATLQLPDHSQLEVGEGTTLDELVNRLLASQTGARLPSGIEVIAVERITIEHASPLRSAARALARTLRLPASWQAAVEPADGASMQAASLLDHQAAASKQAGGMAAQAASVSSKQAAAAADVEVQAALLAAAGEGDDEDKQRLPMTAFDDEYMDDVDAMEQPGRRLMLQGREAAAAAALEEDGWQPVKLFGPRMPALQQLQPVVPRGQEPGANPPVLRIRVVVVLKQRAGSSHASLLDRLALPAQTLGRRAAAGTAGGSGSSSSRVQLRGALSEAALAQLVALQRQQQQQGFPNPPPAADYSKHPLLLVAVDAVFVGAAVVAFVCTTLLLVDLACHGRRRRSAEQGCEQQQALRAPLLVVAAEEAAAARKH
ncbi:hypothetical protein ABPG75_011731 [Micractinium tetrahymenae]